VKEKGLSQGVPKDYGDAKGLSRLFFLVRKKKKGKVKTLGKSGQPFRWICADPDGKDFGFSERVQMVPKVAGLRRAHRCESLGEKVN
jgi:hypothetical protein